MSNEIKRNLPNSAYQVALITTGVNTGDEVLDFANLAGFPGTGETGKIYLAVDTNKIYSWTGAVYSEISSVGDLAAVLAAGNATGGTNIIVTTGDFIKSSAGGTQVSLASSAIDMTTDNGGYVTPYIYVDGTYTELSSTDGGAFFHSSKTGKFFQADGLNKYGLFLGADPAVDNGSLFLGQGVVIVNNTANDQNINPLNSVLGVAINTKSSTIKAGVEYSVILGGDTSVAKTSHTAYVRQIGFHESGTIEGLLNNLTLTADRAWNFPDKSGTVAMLVDITGTNSGVNTGDEPNANTTTAGVVVQATQPEVDAGTDDAKYVTPNDLEDKTLGTYTGTTISDNPTLKVALQELETAVELSSAPKSDTEAVVSFAGIPMKATVTFGTAFANALYNPIAIGQGVDNYNITVESILAGSFVINLNSNVAPTNPILWTATKHNNV